MITELIFIILEFCHNVNNSSTFPFFSPYKICYNSTNFLEESLTFLEEEKGVVFHITKKLLLIVEDDDLTASSLR
jgi:hypothetical protein